MASNIRAVHKRKPESINRAFNSAPFATRRVLFSDAANPALMISQPPALATCVHPYADMKITNFTISPAGHTLRLDAYCQSCGVSYSKSVASAEDEPVDGLP